MQSVGHAFKKGEETIVRDDSMELLRFCMEWFRVRNTQTAGRHRSCAEMP